MELVSLFGEHGTSEVAIERELAANVGDLLVATALMVRNVVAVVRLLLRQVAILGLGANAHGTIETLKGGSRVILASRALVAATDEVTSNRLDLLISRDRDVEVGDGRNGGHAWIALLALWYFDSTSFPYPSLWRFFFQFF
jgi:hypothetical protein